MSVPNPNPNEATVGGMFSQSDLEGGGGGNTVLVEEGSYQLLLSANANKKNGGIVFVEGVIQAGLHAGKEVKVFTFVFHKKPGQKTVGMKNLAAVGLSPEFLSGLQLQLGIVEGGNYVPLYEAIAAYINGRQVNAELVLNTYDNSVGAAQTDMQVKVGAMTLLGAPAAPAVGAAPGVPAVAAAPPPPPAAVAAAAPPVAPPVAPAVAPIAAPVAPIAPVAAVAPVAPVAEVGVATPASPVAPVAPPQPPEVPVAAPVQPVVPQPEVAAAPAPPAAPAAGTVPVVGEPSF